MKMRCIARCQFKGDIVRLGQEVEIDDETLKSDPIAKSAFAPVDPVSAAKRKPASAPVVAGLTRRQALLKLTSLGVTCDDTMDDEELAELFKRSVDSKRQHDVR